VELAWTASVEDVMSFEERMLAHVLSAVAGAHGPAIQEHFKTEVTVPRLPFPRLTLAEGLSLAGAAGPPATGGDAGRDDPAPAGARAVSPRVLAEPEHEFASVRDCPAPVRPFYPPRPDGKPH